MVEHPLAAIRRLAGIVFLASLVLPGASSAGGYDRTLDGADLVHDGKHRKGPFFRRVATWPVFENTDIGEETVAEIVTASKDGMTLIYTDGEQELVGFVDITDPSSPTADGTVPVGGEPTSVDVAGGYALVAVNTSPDFVNPSGVLKVIDIETRAIVAEHDLGGQPDSIAVSPDERYAAVAIENERDEDLGNGEPPQLPAGFLVIVDLVGDPMDWALRTVGFEGVPDLFPEDAEPEYVDINRWNIAAVTLQENNHIVLVKLRDGSIIRDFSAGTVDLRKIDVVEDRIISLDGKLKDVPREPDAITWVGNRRLATADEGDLFGGSRGFTLFHPRGKPIFKAGNSVEHLAVRIGHYPDERSENKGNEPEGAEYGVYGGKGFLFIGSERSNVILVYRLVGTKRLRLVQVLPATVGPEGLKAIPGRNLFVVASEVDARDDKIRSSITIYALDDKPTYPTILSANGKDRKPIAWGALSGLAADRYRDHLVYAVVDSFYQESRILKIDRSDAPAVIFDDIHLTQDGERVNLDLEGVVQRARGGFWVVSEGAGSVDDEDRPVESKNLLLKVSRKGKILKTVELPAATNALQRRFGFEGVAVTGRYSKELVYVAFQREWVGDPDDHVRIGRFEPATGEWRFFYYPIDAPTSSNGGWVGLSEIVALDDKTFAVVERDNQGGPDASIKQIATFSIDGLEPQPEGGGFPLVTKTVVRDLIPDLTEDKGFVLEKVEGLTVTKKGDVLIVTDNDGVDDASGETQFIDLGDSVF